MFQSSPLGSQRARSHRQVPFCCPVPTAQTLVARRLWLVDPAAIRNVTGLEEGRQGGRPRAPDSTSRKAAHHARREGMAGGAKPRCCRCRRRGHSGTTTFIQTASSPYGRACAVLPPLPGRARSGPGIRVEGRGKGSGHLGLWLGGLKGQVTQGSGSEERGADLCLHTGLLGAPKQDSPRRHTQGCPEGSRMETGAPTREGEDRRRGESHAVCVPAPLQRPRELQGEEHPATGEPRDPNSAKAGPRMRPAEPGPGRSAAVQGQNRGPPGPAGLAQGGKRAGLPSLRHSARGPGPPEEVGANQSQMWEQHKTW